MHTKHEKGFTLLEILAVLAIMGILAALAVPRFLLSTSTAEEEVCDANKGTMSVQVERYYLGNSDTYPAATTDITGETDYFPNGAPECPGGGIYAISSTTGIVTCSIH